MGVQSSNCALFLASYTCEPWQKETDWETVKNVRMTIKNRHFNFKATGQWLRGTVRTGDPEMFRRGDFIPNIQNLFFIAYGAMNASKGFAILWRIAYDCKSWRVTKKSLSLPGVWIYPAEILGASYLID